MNSRPGRIDDRIHTGRRSFLLGVIGSALGVALGWLLASGYVQFIAATVNKLVLLVDVDKVVLPIPAAVGGLLRYVA